MRKEESIDRFGLSRMLKEEVRQPQVVCNDEEEGKEDEDDTADTQNESGFQTQQSGTRSGLKRTSMDTRDAISETEKVK